MSFKIICNNCGNEIVFRNNFEGIAVENMIEIYSTLDGRIIIECIECGNDITSKEMEE